ncbi:MAG: tetratricopeptide (TPR) repeat protein [Alteromonadaceae bacterium]|jgi:tetratricopeptide (TPR) repeat protein
MDTAANGDVQYRQRNFTDAQQSYRDSLHQFKSLIARVDSIFDAQVSTGKQAIIDAQAQQAIDSYQLALYLKPDSQAAQQGLARAEAQSSVIKLVHKGTELMKRKQLKEAKQAFSEALTYDSQSKPAQQQLALVKQAIIDDNFARSMSGGFNALNARQFVKAIKAFNRAAKIKPANKEAQDARVQAKNNHVEAQITGYFEQGEAFEQVEKWLLANDQYQQVLELDKTVIKARVSEIRSGVRAQLDDDLTQMLDNPQRLASQNVYNQARKLYRDAIGIKNRGPVLAGQITSLKQWLTNIKQPVALQLKSDNQTLVTLYKIGELGSFTAKNMDLKPGKYTVIGTRSGYRDIRREFTLEPNKALTTIVVQCEEKIRL